MSDQKNNFIRYGNYYYNLNAIEYCYVNQYDDEYRVKCIFQSGREAFLAPNRYTHKWRAEKDLKEILRMKNNSCSIE